MDKRLVSLDGFRGILAVFVLWQHLSLVILKFQSNNPLINWVFWFIGEQGGLAVYFFFVLAGFLMARLYPKVTDTKQFLLKRISRIFPIYWSACLIYTIHHIYQLDFEILILTLIATLVFFKYFWRWLLRSKMSQVNLIWLLIIFVFFSALLLLFAPAPWLQATTSGSGSALGALITFCANATFTFGLTNQVPIVNAVFWSMGLEMMFYLLYPLISHVISTLEKSTHQILKFLLFFLAMSLYLVFVNIFHQIFNFSVFRFETSLLFTIGIFWGYLHRNDGSMQSRFRGFINHHLVKAVMLLTLIFVMYSNILHLVFGKGVFTESNRAWISITPVFLVFGYILYGAGRSKVILENILSSKLARKLGDMSYSLYLFHGFALIPFVAINPHDNLGEVTFKLISYTFIAIFVAGLIHLTLEKDYFVSLRKMISSFPDNEVFPLKMSLVATFLTLQIFILFYFRPDNIKKFVPISPTKDRAIVLGADPIEISFVSSQKDLGIVVLRLKYDGPVTNGEDLKYLSDLSNVDINLFDSKNNRLASTTIPAWGFGEEGKGYQVGFPIQTDSENKKYLIKISASKSKSESILLLPASKIELIHILNKTSLLKDKTGFFRLLGLFFLQPGLYIYSFLNLCTFLIATKFLQKNTISEILMTIKN